MNISTKKFLVGILVIATLLRIASALYQGNIVTSLPGIHDQTSYDELAQRVAGGYGFSFATGHWPTTRAGEPTAHWSYLYTLYLAAVYTLFGVQPVMARLIQAIIAGIVHTWLAWRVGRRIFGPTTGLIAASLSAVYIYFFYYAGGLLTETFYIIGILWAFDVTLRLMSRPSSSVEQIALPAFRWRLWLELGLAIGVTVLLRQLFLLFVPFLFLWLWWTERSNVPPVPGTGETFKRSNVQTLKGLIGATFIVVIMIAPWTVRNYRAFNTFVPLNTNAGYVLFWSNHPTYGTNYVGLLGAQAYYDLIPTELRHLNEAELDRALLKKGIEFIIDDPIRFILLSINRIKEYFKFWPSAESGMISNIARVGSFGICLPAMLYGLWVSATRVKDSKNREQRAAIILLYLFIIVYTTIHLLSWALIRYRLPVDAVLLIFAALGLETLAQRFHSLPVTFPGNIAKILNS